jgi:hypothetical protein
MGRFPAACWSLVDEKRGLRPRIRKRLDNPSDHAAAPAVYGRPRLIARPSSPLPRHPCRTPCARPGGAGVLGVPGFVRHRQPKGTGTDRPGLSPWHQCSTLPFLCRPFHRSPSPGVRGRGAGAGLHLVARRAAAALVRPSAGFRPADPHPGRSHQLGGHGDRAVGGPERIRRRRCTVTPHPSWRMGTRSARHRVSSRCRRHNCSSRVSPDSSRILREESGLELRIRGWVGRLPHLLG